MTLITQLGEGRAGTKTNASGTTLIAVPQVNDGGIAIVMVGWNAPSAVVAPTLTWDGTSATLITTASGNNNTLHIALFSIPDPTTTFGVGNAKIVTTFATTVAVLTMNMASFSGTTAISTATIVRSTGASTLIGTTISDGPPFSLLYAAAGGTRETEQGNFTSAHSSMVTVIGTAGSSLMAWVTAYSESLSDRIVWNSSVESSFVAIGFALDPEVHIFNVNPHQPALRFHARISNLKVSGAVPSQLLNVQVAEKKVSGVVQPQLLNVILED